MDIKYFNKGNLETINFLESATELKRLKRYYDAEHVKRYIGAAIHSSYSIGYLNGDTFIALDPNQTIFNSDEDIELYVFGNANLDTAFINNGSGEIGFSGPGSITVDGNSVYDGGGGGIPDAPQDGKEYVRQDGQWVEASGGIAEVPKAEYNITGGIKMSRDSATSTTYISFDGTDTPNVS